MKNPSSDFPLVSHNCHCETEECYYPKVTIRDRIRFVFKFTADFVRFGVDGHRIIKQQRQTIEELVKIRNAQAAIIEAKKWGH